MQRKNLIQLVIYAAGLRRHPGAAALRQRRLHAEPHRVRYLALAMVSMALSLSWGYAGILNLGQAMSFGLGSYAMAMALKLRTIPVHTGSEGLPDFMVWNNVESLPLL